MTTERGSSTSEQFTWSRGDTAVMLRLPIGIALAWSAGEGKWEKIALIAARRRRQRGKADISDLEARLRLVLGGDWTDAKISQLADGCFAARTVRHLQFLRCHRPDGWHPPARLRGREHIDAAWARGHGAILWLTPTAYASLLTKLTLHRSGLPLSHLSRWYHGVSRTRWGVRLLNPLQTRAEDQFLAERITIAPHQSPLAAMRQVRRRLQENRLVSITVGSESASIASLPFLCGAIALATGPIKLAAATGAPLLPVVTFLDTDGVFTTTIEPPLAIEFGADRPTTPVLRQLVCHLERQALLYPEQFFWPGGLSVFPRRHYGIL